MPFLTFFAYLEQSLLENGGEVGLGLASSYPIGGVVNMSVFGLEVGLEFIQNNDFLVVFWLFSVSKNVIIMVTKWRCILCLLVKEIILN